MPEDFDAIPNEITIARFAGVELTSHRVRMGSSDGSTTELRSFTLDAVDSCVIWHTSNKKLLYVAFFLAVGGLGLADFKMGGIMPQLMGMTAIALIVAYFLSRYTHLVIRSTRTEIEVSIERRQVQEAEKFVDRVEAAKCAWFDGRPA